MDTSLLWPQSVHEVDGSVILVKDEGRVCLGKLLVEGRPHDFTVIGRKHQESKVPSPCMVACANRMSMLMARVLMSSVCKKPPA